MLCKSGPLVFELEDAVPTVGDTCAWVADVEVVSNCPGRYFGEVASLAGRLGEAPAVDSDDVDCCFLFSSSS